MTLNRFAVVSVRYHHKGTVNRSAMGVEHTRIVTTSSKNAVPSVQSSKFDELMSTPPSSSRSVTSHTSFDEGERKEARRYLRECH